MEKFCHGVKKVLLFFQGLFAVWQNLKPTSAKDFDVGQKVFSFSVKMLFKKNEEAGICTFFINRIEMHHYKVGLVHLVRLVVVAVV